MIIVVHKIRHDCNLKSNFLKYYDIEYAEINATEYQEAPAWLINLCNFLLIHIIFSLFILCSM